MDDKTNSALKQLAVSSLGTCLDKLSRVSSGSWTIASASVRRETLGGALTRYPFKFREAAAVYFNVAGKAPFVSMMLFEPDEVGLVSKCFLGYAFPGARLPEEVVLLEIGNIVLNSVVSVVSNGLKRVLMPAVPRYVRGNAAAMAFELGGMLDLRETYRVITVVLDIRSGGDVGGSTVLCLIPDGLAGELVQSDLTRRDL